MGVLAGTDVHRVLIDRVPLTLPLLDVFSTVTCARCVQVYCTTATLAAVDMEPETSIIDMT